ncbi:hypothetical protein ACWJJH_18805 [Endozoicomonadaceae bacterium StTr2]
MKKSIIFSAILGGLISSVSVASSFDNVELPRMVQYKMKMMPQQEVPKDKVTLTVVNTGSDHRSAGYLQLISGDKTQVRKLDGGQSTFLVLDKGTYVNVLRMTNDSGQYALCAPVTMTESKNTFIDISKSSCYTQDS